MIKIVVLCQKICLYEAQFQYCKDENEKNKLKCAQKSIFETIKKVGIPYQKTDDSERNNIFICVYKRYGMYLTTRGNHKSFYFFIELKALRIANQLNDIRCVHGETNH